jgi:hypothetical protein
MSERHVRDFPCGAESPGCRALHFSTVEIGQLASGALLKEREMTDQTTNQYICRAAILIGVAYGAAMALLGLFTFGAVTFLATK